MHPLIDLSKRPKRHSYSSIARYRECPARYAFGYIAKLPEESSAAMDRGTRLHKLAEDYVKGEASMPVPYPLKKIAITIFQLRERGAKAEETWLLDRDWQPTEDPDVARIKAIVDVHWIDNDVLRIHDYKSGREYPKHADQLEFYGAVGLRRFPDARRAVSSAVYIDAGNEGNRSTLDREMLPRVIRRWQTDMDRLDGDGRFLPTAGGHCKWCSYRSDKGGPCNEWVKA